MEQERVETLLVELEKIDLEWAKLVAGSRGAAESAQPLFARIDRQRKRLERFLPKEGA